MSSMSCFDFQGTAQRRLEDDEEAISPDDGEVLRTTMRLYGSLYLGLLLLFCYVRRKYRAYNVRAWSPHVQCDLATKRYGFINWMWHLYAVSEDDLLDQCGMDSLCFLRMLEFGFKVSIVGCFNAIWLMPIYKTAPSSDETDYIEDKIVQVSVSNVPESSPRLIATAIAAWIIFGTTMHLILKEFEWFTQKRHRFLSKAMPRNYTVYVMHLSDDYNDSSKLLNFFRSSLNSESVLEAHVALQIPKLEKKVARRDTVIAKLEHAIALEKKTGVAPTHLVSITGEKADSIETYTMELTKLNEEITEAIDAIAYRNAADAFQTDLEDAMSKRSVPISLIRPQTTDQSVVSGISGADNVAETSSNREEPQKSDAIEEEEIEFSDEDASDEKSDSEQKGMMDTLKQSARKAKKKAKETTKSLKNTVTEKAQETHEKAMKILGNDEDGTPRESGFVTFKTLSATHAALQMLHHSKPFNMQIAEAPNPDDIFWGNVGKTHEQLQSGKLIGLTLTVLLCFFWTIPVAFVASLSSVDALKESVPFLEDWIEAFPALEQILAQLAPLLLVMLNAVLPFIVIEFAKLEGPVSTAVLEASLFVKLAAFMIIQTFFVGSISGSVTKSISDAIDNPESVVSLLANSLPTQAIFYVQILLVSTFLGQGLELLRVLALGIAAVRSCVGPNLTEKERNSTWMGLSPIADPWEFEYAEVLAEGILYFMVTFVYSSLSPITNFFLALCYILLGSGYRHQFIYIYPPTPDSGGKLWTGFIGIVQTCMLIAEITIFGYLGLKKAPVAAGLMIPLIIVTVLFNFYIRQQHFHVTDHLPTNVCQELDRKNNYDGPMDFSFVKGEYRQPALKVKRALPDNFGTERELAHEPIPFLAANSEADDLEDVDLLKAMPPRRMPPRSVELS